MRSHTRHRGNAVQALPYLAAILYSTSARADAPLGYLSGNGPRNVSHLTWGLLLISIIVFVIVIAILLIALWRGWWQPKITLPGTAPVSDPPGGVRAIDTGLVISALVLFGVTVWTVATIAGIASPPRKPRLTIEVTARLWWWDVRYLADDPTQIFTTANEIHIPVGEPVSIVLKSPGVIHSFWVPRLSGKTDLIPGQTNVTWLEADAPGIYRGQCAEYCGLQHAHMGMEVIASPEPRFTEWRRKQLLPAQTPTAETAKLGRAVFMQRCSICHAVRGTPAGGVVGPDLTHLMSRRTLAAATLPNRPGFLSGWIADPQHIKPGAKMPMASLSGPELNQVRDYLQTLQ